ncbi:MAG: dihydrolipoamide acetyltransferase family protein [Phycisphaerales bacterium]
MAGKVSSDPNQFILPDLGEGLEEAELIKWVVSEGDTVDEHDILAEMETDKALVEVPSPRAGTIKTLHGSDGDIIKVGAVFVTYEGGDDTPARAEQDTELTTEAAEEEPKDAGTVVGSVSDSLAGMGSGDGKALAAPAVRRLARDLGIDIDSVAGTGIGGRVTAKDVRNAAEGGGSKPAQQQRQTESKPAPQAASQSQARPQTSRPAETRRPLNLPSTNVGQSYAPQQPQAPQPSMQPSYQHYPPQQPGYGYAPPAYPYPPQPYPAYPPYGYAPPPPPPGYGYPQQPMPQHGPQQGLPAAPGYQGPAGYRPIPDPAQQGMVQPGQAEAHIPFKGIRRTIANRLRDSVNSAVHFTVMDEADVTSLDSLRKEVGAQSGVKLSFLPFLCAAVSKSLAGRFGAMNAIVDEQNEEIVQYGAVNMGIATDTENGLMVPVIRDADRMNVVELGQAISEIASSARDRSIPRDQLMGSTFTISNVGSHAGKFATPVINSPEVAILAVGKAYDGVVVRDGQAMVGKIMPLSLACDHRVVDGATAALALAEIVESLQNPESLL